MEEGVEKALFPLRISTTAVWIRAYEGPELPSALGALEYGTDAPRQLLVDVADALAGLPVPDGADRDRMMLALDRLDAAVADRLWYPDGVQLTDRGPRVFTRCQRAVAYLMEIEDESLGPVVRDAVELILLATATLARNEIEAAEMRGDTDAVAAAEAEMDAALQQMAAGRPDLAVERHGSAREIAHLPPPRLGDDDDDSGKDQSKKKSKKKKSAKSEKSAKSKKSKKSKKPKKSKKSKKKKSRKRGRK
jgi:hypothetical protein